MAEMPIPTEGQYTCRDCWADNFGDGPVVLCPKHAATDDLLAALRFFIDVCEEGGNGEGWTLGQAVERGNAAIARAGGQS